MSQEVVAALVGTAVGFILSGALSIWLHIRQRGEAEQDWHRDNQKEIDRKAEDFVIEVQAFAFDTSTMRPAVFSNSMTNFEFVFDYVKSVELSARANAFEARVADPELREHIQELHTELLLANHRGKVEKDNKATIHAHCQQFYHRMRKLYGGPPPKAKQEQPPKLEYRAAPGPMVVAKQEPDDTQPTSPETSP